MAHEIIHHPRTTAQVGQRCGSLLLQQRSRHLADMGSKSRVERRRALEESVEPIDEMGMIINSLLRQQSQHKTFTTNETTNLRKSPDVAAQNFAGNEGVFELSHRISLGIRLDGHIPFLRE